MNFIKKTILILITLSFSSSFLSAQSPSLQDSLNLLTEKGIQLDEKDREWLSIQKNRTETFAPLEKEINPDDLPLIQIFIKLSSNELFDLSDEEVEANDALLTDIIHGSFDQFDKAEYKMMSAASWHKIIKTQIEADSKEKK